MARNKFDRHFKCPKSLKTLFALTKSPGWFRATMMDAHNVALHTEYAVEPRSAKSIPDEGKNNRPQRKRAA
jgi:hypothetical protein